MYNFYSKRGFMFKFLKKLGNGLVGAISGTLSMVCSPLLLRRFPETFYRVVRHTTSNPATFLLGAIVGAIAGVGDIALNAVSLPFVGAYYGYTKGLKEGIKAPWKRVIDFSFESTHPEPQQRVASTTRVPRAPAAESGSIITQQHRIMAQILAQRREHEDYQLQRALAVSTEEDEVQRVLEVSRREYKASQELGAFENRTSSTSSSSSTLNIHGTTFSRLKPAPRAGLSERPHCSPEPTLFS